jgi:predicted Zn-dependent protease
MNALADLKRATAEYGPALELYDKVLAQDAGNYDALYGAGACHLRQRDAQRALPFFRRALKADPNSVAAKMAVGETLLVSGQGTQAIAMLEEAARSDPNFKRLQYLLARAYRAAGRQEDAERALKAYRQLDAAASNSTGGMDDEK